MSKKAATPMTPEAAYAGLSASARAIELSEGVTVDDFHRMLSNRSKISHFVFNRFYQRYIKPFEKVCPDYNSGFAQMAVCCLMIEAMESFRNGWGDTTTDAIDKNGKKLCGGDIFNLFFDRYDEFLKFRGLGKEFYKSIRCGILHQAESKNGWLISRDGELLDLLTRTINSTIFRRRMKKCLQAYCDELKTVDETSDVWQNFKIKMTCVIQNCVQGALKT